MNRREFACLLIGFGAGLLFTGGAWTEFGISLQQLFTTGITWHPGSAMFAFPFMLIMFGIMLKRGGTQPEGTTQLKLISTEVPIRTYRLHSAEDPAFQTLLRIYTASLPASERKSPEALKAMLARREYIFLTASYNDITIAFAIATKLWCDPKVYLLEYLAVDPAHRCRGVGHHLFHALTQLPELTRHAILAEVEAITDPTDRTAIQRKSFYRNVGFSEISDLAYLMPAIADTLPPPMHLLIYDFRHPVIPKRFLQRWLQCIYSAVYAQPISDPRIDEMLTPLPDRISITPLSNAPER